MRARKSACPVFACEYLVGNVLHGLKISLSFKCSGPTRKNADPKYNNDWKKNMINNACKKT